MNNGLRSDTDEQASSREPRTVVSTRRALLSVTTATTLALAGCSGITGPPESRGAANDEGSPTGTPRPSDSPADTATGAPDAAVETNLQTARTELDAAFSEMYKNDLVQFDRKVWTPRYEDLGSMDLEIVEQRIATARTALSNAREQAQPDTEQAVRVDLLEHVANIAAHGSTFYRRFSLTFEKVYQYEYLIDSETEYERAVEKMGKARELLATWTTLGEKLTEHVRAVLQLYESHPDIEAAVPSFDVERWNYTTHGVEQYAYQLEPRFVAFEAYAEAVGADLTGLDHLENDEYQAAQEAFQTARNKIGQADRKFTEANSRGDSFFERRARIYHNRIPLFEEGYLLHLRAANEFVRGNTENANDLRFRGTTKIRDAFAKHPISEE